jgi:hypothetical protein
MFNFLDLPKEHQEYFKARHSFRNDICLEFLSEFQPEEGETWENVLTEEGIVQYWKGQVEENNYKGDLEQFVIDYNLKFERWVITQNFDLKDIESIIVRICW